MAKTTTSTPQDSAGGRRVAARPAPSSSSSGLAARGRNAGSPLDFFQESRAELRKVTWPTRQDAMNLTIAVIGMTLAIAVFLGLIDAGLDKLVSVLLGTG